MPPFGKIAPVLLGRHVGGSIARNTHRPLRRFGNKVIVRLTLAAIKPQVRHVTRRSSNSGVGITGGRGVCSPHQTFKVNLTILDGKVITRRNWAATTLVTTTFMRR